MPRAAKSFLSQPLELLVDVGHMQSRFGLFRDSGTLGVYMGNSLPQTCKIFEIIFATAIRTPS